MISPLPPSAVPASDTRDSGDPKDKQAVRGLFAQLLGDGDDGPSGLPPGAGDLQIALTIPESAIGQGQVAAADAAAPLARVFNQDGFFGHANLVRESVDEAARMAEAVPDALGGMPIQGSPPPVDADRPAQGMAAPTSVKATARGPASARMPEGGAARGGGSNAVVSPALRGAGPEPLSSGPEGEAGEVPAPRRLLRAAMAAQSPVQIAISEAEQGLRVTAHVAGLEETERRQLRQAITALLARHGLRAEHIQINATPIRGTEG